MLPPVKTDVLGKHIKLKSGLNAHYKECGAGHPLILLHGSFDCVSSMWDAQIPAFAAQHRVIVPDLRGHGLTASSEEKTTLGLLAQDAVELAEALGLERPALCGVSMGGRATLEAGMRYPGAFGALIVGAAQSHRPFPAGMLEKMRSIGIVGAGEVDPEILERTDPQRAARLRSIHTQSSDQWKTLMRQLSHAWYPTCHPLADYRGITTPALLVVGDRDPVVRVEDVLEMFQAMPTAELAVLPNHDHCSFFGRSDTPFGPMVLDFLARRLGR